MNGIPRLTHGLLACRGIHEDDVKKIFATVVRMEVLMGIALDEFYYALLLDTEEDADDVASDVRDCLSVIVEKIFPCRRPGYDIRGSRVSGELERDHQYQDEGGVPNQSYRYRMWICRRMEKEEDALSLMNAAVLCLHARGVYRLALIDPHERVVLRLNSEGAGPPRRYPSAGTRTILHAHPVIAFHEAPYIEDFRCALVAAYPDAQPKLGAGGRLYGFETDDVLVSVCIDRQGGEPKFVFTVTSDSEDWQRRPAMREECAEHLLSALRATGRYELTVERDFDPVEEEQRARAAREEAETA